MQTMFHNGLVTIAIIGALAGISLAFLAQRYWFARAWRLAGRIHPQRTRKGVRGALLALVFIVFFTALAGVLRNMQGITSRGSFWTAFLAFWLTSSILSYLFIKIVDVVDWIWRRMRSAFSSRPENSDDIAPSNVALARTEPMDHSRRHFFHVAGVVAGAVPFISAGYGFAEERFQYRVREVTIPIANLPRSLDGLRITQLSDIHAGSFMPISQVGRAVGMANELGGDLVVVTGDFISTRSDPLEDCIAELSRLRAPLGVWGCNGNHEVYARAEAKSAELFRRHGMRLLRQENAEVRWQGSSFNLIGVDYQSQNDAERNRAPMLIGAESLVRGDIPNILLSHNPNSFPRAAELGIELSLAGHTHGGQVRVEILDHRWSPAEFFTPYVAGDFHRPLRSSSHLSDDEVYSTPGVQQFSSSALYVNRGLGTIGAPVRLGVPPEITLITLRSA
jgi:predicted MPP superfamily phosphohydrolase